MDGDDISMTLASVLKEDVMWQALPAFRYASGRMPSLRASLTEITW